MNNLVPVTAASKPFFVDDDRRSRIIFDQLISGDRFLDHFNDPDGLLGDEYAQLLFQEEKDWYKDWYSFVDQCVAQRPPFISEAKAKELAEAFVDSSSEGILEANDDDKCIREFWYFVIDTNPETQWYERGV